MYNKLKIKLYTALLILWPMDSRLSRLLLMLSNFTLILVFNKILSQTPLKLAPFLSELANMCDVLK